MRFGISNTNDDSIIKESARISVQDIATEEQLAALPHYDGESSLADYHYLQLMREPLTFDQLVEAEYVNFSDKSCVMPSNTDAGDWQTAYSNNILRAGKHYVSFTPILNDPNVAFGVMRPGQANQYAVGAPDENGFFENFHQRLDQVGEHNNNCVLYYAFTGSCYSSDWEDSSEDDQTYRIDAWNGMESTSSGDEMGMLLDLDKGTLTVYKDGRKLGVMKSGLAGPYCWVVSMHREVQIRMKRGTIPSG